MSRGLRSYPEPERASVADRRMKSTGLGGLGAADYHKAKIRKNKAAIKEKVKS